MIEKLGVGGGRKAERVTLSWGAGRDRPGEFPVLEGSSHCPAAASAGVEMTLGRSPALGNTRWVCSN